MGPVLLLFFALTLAQSNFRDQGFDQMDITQFHFSSLFLAFDQFDSMYLAFQTYDSFDRPQNRWPFAILSDIFTYYFPREWFKSLGITKLSHINYLEWECLHNWRYKIKCNTILGWAGINRKTKY